jgi:hypothetical protein
MHGPTARRALPGHCAAATVRSFRQRLPHPAKTRDGGASCTRGETPFWLSSC